MNHLKISLFFLIIYSTGQLWSVSPGGNRRNNNSATQTKEYLFPGTGFFKKNRDPIDNNQAKVWFLEASKAEIEGDFQDAIQLYEKFALRRCDYRHTEKNVEIQTIIKSD